MFKMVTKILGVIALTGWMGAANAALIFDFSWDSDNGKIIGEIYGLTDNGDNLSATGIVLSSIDAMQVNIDVMNDPYWSVVLNGFDVAYGRIVNAHIFTYFYDYTINRDFEIRTDSSYAKFNDGNREYSTEEFAFDNRVTVPEPSSVILMLLGLAGLSFARYRKQY